VLTALWRATRRYRADACAKVTTRCRDCDPSDGRARRLILRDNARLRGIGETEGVSANPASPKKGMAAMAVERLAGYAGPVMLRNLNKTCVQWGLFPPIWKCFLLVLREWAEPTCYCYERIKTSEERLFDCSPM